MKTIVTVIIALVLPALESNAQQEFNKYKWPDRHEAAVCLTFDDALSKHLDIVIPMLDSFGVKATFYCSGNSTSLQNQTDAWRDASKHGHELGNHTLFHPCDRSVYAWVKPEFDLSSYSRKQFENELLLANALLEEIDGKTERTFAYPCSNFRVRGDSSIIDLVAEIFPAARNQGPIPPTKYHIDIHFMPSMIVDGNTGAELIAYVEEARDKGTIATFMFHGVGGDHFLDIAPEALRELLTYLKENEKHYWVDTFYNVTNYISSHMVKTK